MLRGPRLVVPSLLRTLSSPSSSSSSASASAAAPSLPQTADVVIVGGGVAGCSLLYHLTKLGHSNVVLLEKDTPTAGSTWHAAGMVWNLRTSEIESQLLRSSWELMTSMEREEGLAAGCHENGGLFLVHSEQRLNEYRRLADIGAMLGIDSHLLSQQETKELYPLLDVSEIIGSLHIPSDGGVDQVGLCEALLRGAVRRGGRVFSNTAVTSIDTKTSPRGYRQVAGIGTNRGWIETGTIVNAAGVWSGEVGRLAGVRVPLWPMRHAYIVTEPIDGVRNMPNIRHNDLSLYVRTQGDRLLIGGYESNPIPCEAEPNFAFSLYELDWEVFGPHMENAAKFLPVLNDTGIKTTVCGPESFTPDHKPLMGEAPELRGFHFFCGFNSAGIMSSPGFAKEMAAWLIRGRPNFDMYSYDIRRYNALLTNNDRWIEERSHEAYAKNHAIRFDRDEALAGRNVLKDPLYEELLAKGCVYQERQGMERPSWFQSPGNKKPAPVLPYDFYGNYGREQYIDYRYRDLLNWDCTFDVPQHFDNVIARECAAVRERVAIFNQSSFGKLFLVGPDAREAANWIFSANIDRPAGATIYTLALNRHAGIEGDLTVSVVAPGNGAPHSPSFEASPGYYLTTAGASCQYILSHIHDVLAERGYNATVLDHSLDMSLLSVQGPLSRELLAPLTDADLSDAAFPFSSHRELSVAGYPCRALRLSFVGELGWELHVPNAFALPLYRALVEAGKRFGGLTDAGFRALDILSLEKGYRHWHGDIRTDDNPLEASMTFTCKLKTPQPFLGRLALEAAKARGPPAKRLVFFTLDDPSVPLNGLEPVLRDGCYVGYLRRADFGPTLGRPIGCGYVAAPGPGLAVNASFLADGHWEVERLGQRYTASAQLKPLFDPQNHRIKGFYDIEKPRESH